MNDALARGVILSPSPRKMEEETMAKKGKKKKGM